jgi:hypothetical protein
MLGLKLGNSLTGLGKTGQNIYSLSFNGTDESVTVNGINGDISVSAGTISTWIKFNAMSANGIILKAQNDSNNNINLHYNNANSEVRMLYKAGGTSVFAVTTDAVENDGKWHHVMGTWNVSEDEVKLYIDGVLKQTSTGVGTWAGSISATSIGNNTAGGSFINAYICEVSVFTTVVPIANIFQANQQPINVTGMSGLIAYWRFDDGTGETAIDSSGKEKTGTLVNTPTWSTDVPYKAG